MVNRGVGLSGVVSGTNQTAHSSQEFERRPRIIAAIPCYNEERFIGSVVVRARQFVDEVIVIDDGSTDDSGEIAKGAGAVVFQHDCNRGYGAAVRSAIEKGQRLEADVMVLLDGDGQHDARDIPALVEPVLRGEVDVVVGSRFLGVGEKGPIYRRLGQRVLTSATNVGAGCKISDSQSGFRAFSAKALAMLDLTEGGMSVSSEMQFAMGRSGIKVGEVPIAVFYSSKAKRNPVGHGASVLARIVTLFSLKNPMMLFGVPGLALLVGGLVLGTRVLAIYGETGQFAVGSALVTTLLTLSGLLLMFAALILKALKELLRGGVVQLAREVKGHVASEESGERAADRK